MFAFSVGETTFGFAEETITFYGLITVTMTAAGFDSLVGVSVVLLGSRVCVLGSTVNPFVPGIAIDSINKTFRELGIPAKVNSGTVILLGTVIWFSSFAITCWFVMRYAENIKRDMQHSLLSEAEQDAMQQEFTGKADEMRGFYR